MKILSCTSIAALLMCLLPFINSASAQDISGENTETATAILDTSIPFAIGAREGEQTIRGSFGWPTFQEGFVEGVYFRFDPDGYARFSTSPRLDDDVFEVRCQNATTLCIAQKNGLEIGLTAQGRPQIRISGVTPTDTFFISDRKNELPLPNSILGPIDQRLETLLSTDGDLIIRRELETLQTLSLSGFAATVTYLRWVAQNQASFVFPRNWPAPSQQTSQQNNGLTLPDTWVDTRSNIQPAPKRSNIQNLRVNARRNLNQNAEVLPNRNTQFTAQPSQAFVTNDYVTSANIFAQEAQGRNLPADINRFEKMPSQDYQQQSNNQATALNTQGVSVGIRQELEILHQSMRNLETKIDNLTLRLTREIRSVGVGPAGRNRPVSQTYQGIDESIKNAWEEPGNTNVAIPEEERLRNLVIESLLKQPQQNDSDQSVIPNPSVTGEVTVKKNIVERLLEELNSQDKTVKEPVQPVATQSEGFISLSDYVNKIMQEGKQN
jgi:hypothetical protein